jgi:hypothetical protein
LVDGNADEELKFIEAAQATLEKSLGENNPRT